MHKVLIVENNPVIIQLLTHFFQAEGCDIRIANDGLQALSMLNSFMPDILFTDIIMPKISGDELCRIFRQTPKLKDIFIVVYSAIAYEDEQQIFELGADLYIAKGPNNTIKNHIHHVLDQFRSGKRREDILHGKEELHQRVITKELLLSRRHYHAIMENLAEAVIEMDDAGQIVRANRAAQELLNRDLTTLLASRLTDHLTGPDFNLVEPWFAQISRGGSPQFCSSYNNPLVVGTHQVILKLLRITEKDEFFIIAILQDITPHKLTEEKLVKTAHEFNAIMESIEYGILFMDADLRARIANRAFRDMWGITDELFASQPTLRDLINFNRYNGTYDVPEERFDRFIEEREAVVKNMAGVSEEFHRKDGLIYQYQCVALPDGGRMLTYFDITKHKNTQAQLARTLDEVHELAYRDPLTGLPNQRLLQERFFLTSSMSKRKGWQIAVMFIDLDGFKKVNDVYGHVAGDMVLKMVARRLLKIVREADTVARIGGDEFLILQTEVNDHATVVHVVDKILQQLAAPFDLVGNEIKIGASIGIAIYPTHGDNIDLLIQKADNAMYQTKSQGKQSYTFAPDY
ncbi:MAG: diguanylate cyclase [Desulfobulbaceae bacterium]|nr:diguanylate cyclase [Desulfobulbaceae bacterium]